MASKWGTVRKQSLWRSAALERLTFRQALLRDTHSFRKTEGCIFGGTRVYDLRVFRLERTR
jgi:hypothetical protein